MGLRPLRLSLELPLLIKEDFLDIGFVGEDILVEYGYGDLNRLVIKSSARPFRQTRVCLYGSRYNPAVDDRNIPPGSRIISEYPNLTRKFLLPGVQFWQTHPFGHLTDRK